MRLRKTKGSDRNSVARELGRHGLRQRDIDEAWGLMQRAVGCEIDDPAQAEEPLALNAAEALQRLDAWENLWFPIARATLERRFPEAAEQLFAQLRQTSGHQGVILTVSIFLDRLEALLGADAGAAQVLAERGLVQGALAEAKALLAILTSVGSAAGAGDPAQRARADEAEQALWGWYREWSTVARTAIREPRRLRKRGLKPIGRPRKAAPAEGPVASAAQGDE